MNSAVVGCRLGSIAAPWPILHPDYSKGRPKVCHVYIVDNVRDSFHTGEEVGEVMSPTFKFPVQLMPLETGSGITDSCIGSAGWTQVSPHNVDSIASQLLQWRAGVC